MSEHPEIINPPQDAIPSAAPLFAKMARIMGRLERINKTGFNSHFQYNFATESDVADVIRVAMSEEGVALLADILEYRKEGSRTLLKIKFTFGCGETGATVSSTWWGEADDKQDKGISKAATAAEKYFLMKTFLLSAGDPEDDSDNSKPVAAATKNTATKPTVVKPAAPKIADKPAQAKSATTADPDTNAVQARVVANDFNAWAKLQKFDSEMVLKALKVSRLGEFDWLQPDALSIAQQTVEAFYLDNQLAG